MAATNLKKLFNRIFVSLTILWIAYCTVLLPILAKRRAEDQFAQAVAECTHNYRASADVNEQAEHDCMVQAQGIYFLSRSAVGSFYGSQNWLSLLVICIAFPLATYGVIMAAAAVARRLRNPHLPNPRRGISIHDTYA